MAMSDLVEKLMELPTLPEIVDTLQARLAQERSLRAKFYEELPDGEKWEFINGQVIMHSPDTVKHMQVRSLVESVLGNYVRLHRLGEVLGEKALCVFPRNDFMPDVLFYRSEKAALLQPKQLKLPPPDLAVEILSESTESRDRGVKFRDYEAHGVEEYWIADPFAELLEQYLLRQGRYELFQKSGTGEVRSMVIQGLCIPVRALFDAAENLAALRRIMSGSTPAATA